MAKERLVVIGGNAAGMSAASQARRHDQSLEIIAFENGPVFSYAA
jgi:NADPH-dependent 2,4-dienoyl-CoA reductase/sulfur reductase-like enzyme